MLDLKTATPAEIDAELATLHGDLYRAEDASARLVGAIENTREGMAKREAGDLVYFSCSPERLERLEANLVEARAAEQAVRAQIAPFEAEFDRRGGWTRAFLVTNVNGHVHRHMRCSTCFATTRYAWLTEFSGHNETEVVEAAGEKACTVCYPSDPVEVLARKSTIELPERRAARLEREKAAAERAAKRAAKALLPDQSALRTKSESLTTLAAARMWLADGFDWGWNHPSYNGAGDRDRVVAAVATKEGKDADTVLAEAAKRAAKRR